MKTSSLLLSTCAITFLLLGTLSASHAQNNTARASEAVIEPALPDSPGAPVDAPAPSQAPARVTATRKVSPSVQRERPTPTPVVKKPNEVHLSKGRVVGGVFVQAFTQKGAAANLINPLADEKYGRGDYNVAYELDNEDKPLGLKFFYLTF